MIYFYATCSLNISLFIYSPTEVHIYVLVYIYWTFTGIIAFVRVDKKGVICEQMGVFRINCIDCLDRTNVVQTAIARIAMETQVNIAKVVLVEKVRERE